MSRLIEISDQIKTIQQARDILREYYESTEFHKKKEVNPDTAIPSAPEDEEVYKLLTAIQQLENYVKKLQNEQFQLLKEHE
jgi:hypothetical protein